MRIHPYHRPTSLNIKIILRMTCFFIWEDGMHNLPNNASPHHIARPNVAAFYEKKQFDPIIMYFGTVHPRIRQKSKISNVQFAWRSSHNNVCGRASVPSHSYLLQLCQLGAKKSKRNSTHNSSVWEKFDPIRPDVPRIDWPGRIITVMFNYTQSINQWRSQKFFTGGA